MKCQLGRVVAGYSWHSVPLRRLVSVMYPAYSTHYTDEAVSLTRVVSIVAIFFLRVGRGRWRMRVAFVGPHGLEERV